MVAANAATTAGVSSVPAVPSLAHCVPNVPAVARTPLANGGSIAHAAQSPLPEFFDIHSDAEDEFEDPHPPAADALALGAVAATTCVVTTQARTLRSSEAPAHTASAARPPDDPPPPGAGGPSGDRGGGPGDGSGGGGGDRRDPSPRAPRQPGPPDGGGGGGGDDGGGDDNASSGSDGSVRRSRRSKRYKVADEIKCGNLPAPAQFRAWKNTILQNINAASGRPDDDALQWALKCEDFEGTPDSELSGVDPKFGLLDRRLSARLQMIATGELGRQITQKAEDALKTGRAVRGRELLRMIFQYYQTNRTADAVYNLTDLQKVRIVKGNIEGFQSTWIMVLSGMRKLPDEDVLELLYYERVETFAGISEDVAHYNRLADGSGGDRSYAFLFNAVQRYLQRTRQRSVREAISRSLGDAGKPAAPGAKGGKAGNGTEKGKGKGKSIRPCFDFQRGECLRGDQCPYSHVLIDGAKGKGKSKGKGKGKGK